MSERGRTGGRVDVSALLQHRQWLQRLAGHLAAPGTTADDAVQDTWLAALRDRPREPERARPWLARVLVNAVRRRLRGERRRLEREQAVAERRGSVDQPAAAGLEQLQLQRRLIGLVDALEEPFRSTVVMRYFEERTAADIARTLGIPEGTVRWRTREALTRLRRALDDQSGGDRQAWTAQLGTMAVAGSQAGPGMSLVWLAAGTLLAVLAASVIILRPPTAPVSIASETGTTASPRPSTSLNAAAAPAARPLLAVTALALASRSVPAPEALARAKLLWARACPETAIDGLCVRPTASSGHVCPQATAAGPRLAGIARRQAEREQALAHWSAVSANRTLPYEIRVQADLALAEDKLEALLALEPLSGIDLDRQAPVRFAESHQRFQEHMMKEGQRAKDATWAFERLAGASEDIPEVHLARARLGQAFAEAARLKLAMQVPAGLPAKNQWGTDEQEAFCQSVARNTGGLFEKARRHFRTCAARATSVNPTAAALCVRELGRLPPEPDDGLATR